MGVDVATHFLDIAGEIPVVEGTHFELYLCAGYLVYLFEKNEGKV